MLSNPYAFQHLLGGSKWDCDALRDKLHQGLPALLAKKGVLAIDETGFLKNGACSYYAVFCRQGTPLERLAEISGYRWTIEECFETAKQEVGLDEYEVRSYIG